MLHADKKGEYISITDDQGDECDLLDIEVARKFFLELSATIEIQQPRYRVKDIWHPTINKGETPWVYSDHPNFNGNVHEFFAWVGQHNGWKLDGVQTERLLGGFE
jgi:hypothetical protein